MKLDTTHSHSHHRAFKSPTLAAALLVMLFAGSGAALADERRGDRGDRDGYRNHEKHEKYDNRRSSRGHRDRDERYDRDRKRDDHRRYDRRHRNDRHHRYDRHRHRHDRRDHRYRDRYRYNNHRYDHYRHHRGRYYYDDRYRYNRHRSRSFDIPRLIARELLHTYSAYHHGRLYHSAHRHHHEVYRFPVYSEYGVEYYPYAYCEGNFFGRGHFRDGRPVFDVRIRF